MDLKDLYRDVIVDHNRNPRNFGKLSRPTRMPTGYNPLCGDRLTLYVNLDGERIREAKFEGSGCAISVASASLLTEAVKGKSSAEVRALFDDVHALLTQHDANVDPREARQARRALRRARVSGAREVREPVLAHAQRRAGPCQPSPFPPNRRVALCTATNTNPSRCNATSKPSWSPPAFR